MNDLNSKIEREVRIIEHHLHRVSRSFGISADQSGNNWCTEDRLVPFTAISGNNDFGADPGDEAKIFGSADTPFITGHTFFDPGFILVNAVSSDSVYFIRLVWSTVDIATGISDGNYSTIPFKFDSFNPVQSTSFILVPIGNDELPVGTKVWIQIKSAVDNATLSFYISAHGYKEV